MNTPNNENAEFIALYRKYVGVLRYRARSILNDRNLAEDAVQDTFIAYLNYKERKVVEVSEGALLYVMVTRIAIDYVRKASRRGSEVDVTERLAVLTEETTQHEKWAIQKALKMMGPIERKAGEYYFVGGLTQEEIAEDLGIERRTIARHIERFRTRMRRLLHPWVEETDQGGKR